MLKGHVFLYQIFGNEICAKVFDTFGKNASGILEGYGDSMEVTYNGSELTISSGVALICGRPVQETSSTTIDAGTTNYYCKLVLTVDLDQENTSADFNQGYYEIVTDASAYPELTQDDIVNTNQGKYQFELARFTTGVSGIDNFVEAKNYLTIGKIINNMDTAEDKTTNAPSIQAVEEYIPVEEIKYPTYTTGVVDISSDERTYYFKQGHMVTVVINAAYSSVSADTYRGVFRLPEGYRPKHRMATVGARKGWGTFNMITFKSDGNIEIHFTAAASGVNMQGEATFYVD